MDPIQYTIQLQRILLLLVGVSFASIIAVLIFLDPNQSYWFVGLFHSILLVLLTSSLSLVIFWWEVTVKKHMTSIIEANQIVYQSAVSGTCIILTLVLQQTRMLNIFTITLLILLYVLFWIWSTSTN